MLNLHSLTLAPILCADPSVVQRTLRSARRAVQLP
jgi:hypothetical protein